MISENLKKNFEGIKALSIDLDKIFGDMVDEAFDLMKAHLLPMKLNQLSCEYEISYFVTALQLIGKTFDELRLNLKRIVTCIEVFSKEETFNEAIGGAHDKENLKTKEEIERPTATIH